MSSTEPSRELPTKVSGAEEGQRTSNSGIANREVAETNIRKGPEIGDDFKVRPKSWVNEAHVNLGPVQDEPVSPFRCLPKLGKNDDSVIRQIFLPHQPVQGPYQEVGV